MKTKVQVLKEYPECKVLINAVISRIGMNSVKDVINHGIDGGFNGFIYYKDTCAFYRRHRKMINQWVFAMAEELGEDAIKMVSDFNCIKDSSEETKRVIGRCIYDGELNDDSTQIENALAWFAAEEVCRLFDNE